MKLRNNKHWLVLMVCCGLAASSMGVCINSVGVFYSPVADSLGVLRGTFTLHMTISSIVSAFMSLYVARLMKHINYKVLLIAGVAMSASSSFLMAFCTSVYPFYILGAIRGAGTCLFSLVPITIIISNWFVKSHGLATSITLSFSGLAGAFCSPFLTSCISNYGWQKTYMIMALLTVILCLPAIIFKFNVNPLKEGLLPYGYVQNNKKIVINDIISDKFNFKSIRFALYALFAVFTCAITGIPSHFPGFALSINLTASIGAMMLSASMIGNILSKLIIGFLSDRIGVFKAALVIVVINIVSLLIFVVIPNESSVIIASFLFGSIYSVAAVGVPLLTKEIFGKSHYTSVFPIISFLTGISGAFTISIIGYVYDFTGSYFPAFVFALVFQIINIIILITLVKNKEV